MIGLLRTIQYRDVDTVSDSGDPYAARCRNQGGYIKGTPYALASSYYHHYSLVPVSGAPLASFTTAVLMYYKCAAGSQHAVSM